MNALDSILYRTRKSVLEALSEISDNNESVGEITLNQCNSCGIWLKPAQLIPDLDNLPICKDCEDYYGK